MTGTGGEMMSLGKLRQGCYLIAQIFQISGRIFEKKLKAYQLAAITPSQGRILFALWQGDNISIRNLSQKTSLSKSTLTVMLDKLEEGGHIRRVPSPQDRREIKIRLTEKDKSLQDSYVKLSGAMTQLSYQGFGASEIDMFEDFLARILENLKVEEKKEERP
jgi:DNA-binding MarR family transcriptional regulator